MPRAPSRAARTGLAVAMTVAAVATACDKAGDTPGLITAPSRAAPLTPTANASANPLLTIFRSRLADPWSARGWRENVSATSPDLLASPDLLLAGLLGTRSATAGANDAALDYASGEVTQEEADAALRGWLFLYPEQGVVGVSMISSLPASAFWAEVSFKWMYQTTTGTVVVRTPGDSPFRCDGPGGTSYSCQRTSRFAFKCDADHPRVGGSAIAQTGAAYVIVVNTSQLVGPIERWHDCPPPPPPPGTSGGGGYSSECWVCQQWFYIWSNGEIDEWWECSENSGDICGLAS
jgi:hypothetical protein